MNGLDNPFILEQRACSCPDKASSFAVPLLYLLPLSLVRQTAHEESRESIFTGFHAIAPVCTTCQDIMIYHVIPHYWIWLWTYL